ncbi:DUF1367 family protein [Vibrio rhizosphaerae]|uniref:DUF1367 family protein n=1 Tax=Vibrio rhizosphaerae TaxID=398736 RepID=A0ABU4IXM6_9VIBR|nr:DUF1367 family protein [Vibrio rhizosphaerae]MDW6094034.1 DUF1367 family protein [Vibrio rhizosphaerae]
MAKLNLVKDISGLKPLGSDDLDLMQKVPLGSLLECDFSQKRNPKFHRKFFALLNLGYEYWEPETKEWRGHRAVKNFEVYREQITILAGYFEATYNLDGSVKVRAKSISFANMDEIEFQELYSKVLDITWNKVLSGIFADKQQLENVVNQLMNF